jgi:hypothetical protein
MESRDNVLQVYSCYATEEAAVKKVVDHGGCPPLMALMVDGWRVRFRLPRLSIGR